MAEHPLWRAQTPPITPALERLTLHELLDGEACPRRLRLLRSSYPWGGPYPPALCPDEPDLLRAAAAQRGLWRLAREALLHERDGAWSLPLKGIGSWTKLFAAVIGEISADRYSGPRMPSVVVRELQDSGVSGVISTRVKRDLQRAISTLVGPLRHENGPPPGSELAVCVELNDPGLGLTATADVALVEASGVTLWKLLSHMAPYPTPGVLDELALAAWLWRCQRGAHRVRLVRIHPERGTAEELLDEAQLDSIGAEVRQRVTRLRASVASDEHVESPSGCPACPVRQLCGAWWGASARGQREGQVLLDVEVSVQEVCSEHTLLAHVTALPLAPVGLAVGDQVNVQSVYDVVSFRPVAGLRDPRRGSRYRLLAFPKMQDDPQDPRWILYPVTAHQAWGWRGSEAYEVPWAP